MDQGYCMGYWMLTFWQLLHSHFGNAEWPHVLHILSGFCLWCRVCAWDKRSGLDDNLRSPHQFPNPKQVKFNDYLHNFMLLDLGPIYILFFLLHIFLPHLWSHMHPKRRRSIHLSHNIRFIWNNRQYKLYIDIQYKRLFFWSTKFQQIVRVHRNSGK